MCIDPYFASGANVYYGWVRVSINNSTGSFVVNDWAYENSGAGILAGAVPAPGALGLLALAFGTFAYGAWLLYVLVVGWA